MSSSSVARVSAVFGVLAIAAIPAGAAIPTFVDTIGVLRASLIAVPVAFLLGLIAISLARRAKFRLDRSVRRRGERTVRFARFLAWAGLYLAVTGGLALGFYGLLLLRSNS
jgi:hypothetical protein